MTIVENNHSPRPNSPTVLVGGILSNLLSGISQGCLREGLSLGAIQRVIITFDSQVKDLQIS